MPALFSSCQEQKQRAWTPAVLTSSFPVHTEVEAKDFSMCFKVPFAFLAHKAVDNTVLKFPHHPWELLHVKQYPLRATGLSTPASVPSPTVSLCLCYSFQPHFFYFSWLAANQGPCPCTLHKFHLSQREYYPFNPLKSKPVSLALQF